MAETTLSIKDGSAATKTLSAIADGGNSDALVVFHGLADYLGTNKASVDANHNQLTIDYNLAAKAALANGAANPTTTKVGACCMKYNGSTWDLAPGIQTSTLLTKTTSTTTPEVSTDQTNYGHRSAVFVLDVTAIDTGTITMTIQGKDSASSNYYTILAGAAVSTVSTNVYWVGINAAAVTNVATPYFLPKTWRVSLVKGSGASVSYTVSVSLMPN